MLVSYQLYILALNRKLLQPAIPLATWVRCGLLFSISFSENPWARPGRGECRTRVYTIEMDLSGSIHYLKHGTHRDSTRSCLTCCDGRKAKHPIHGLGYLTIPCLQTTSQRNGRFIQSLRSSYKSIGPTLKTIFQLLCIDSLRSHGEHIGFSVQLSWGLALAKHISRASMTQIVINKPDWGHGLIELGNGRLSSVG